MLLKLISQKQTRTKPWLKKEKIESYDPIIQKIAWLKIKKGVKCKFYLINRYNLAEAAMIRMMISPYCPFP